MELIGVNGSGKSTLLRTLSGLHDQYEGEFRCSERLYQGHKLGLDELMSPVENLEWFSGLEGSSLSRDAIHRSLEQVGMLDYAYLPCHRMSQGQRRRVSMARWITSRQATWLLDEPFTYLDSEGVEIANAVIEKRCKEGGVVMCATHIPIKYSQKRVIALESLAKGS